MNVTKSNFSAVLKEVEALLPSACFMSFDEEMTGISLSDPTWSITQTPSERYQSMKAVASTYRIIQFGLCLFHKEGDELVARPYNFFAFPAAGTITMDGESTAFNKRHKMDFNQWIYEGIPYLSAHEQDSLKKTLFPAPDKPEKKRSSNGGSITLRTPQDKEFMSNVMESLIKWSELLRPREGIDSHSLLDYQVFRVPDSNSFLRLAIRRQVEILFPHFVVETTDTEDRFRKECVVLRLSPEEKLQRDEQQLVEKTKIFEEQVGLRRLFQAMVSSQVPLVGHNCMYDLMFMLHAFDTLPATLTDFKFQLSHSLPTIIDTKFLATTNAYGFSSASSSSFATSPASSNQPETAKTAVDSSSENSSVQENNASTQENSTTWTVDTISVSDVSTLPLASISSSASLENSPSPALESFAAATAPPASSSSPSSPSSPLPPPPPAPPLLAPRFKNTSLEEVYHGLESEGPYQVRLAEGFTRYAENGAAHEAGYDAYMTGCIYSRFSAPTDDMKNVITLSNTFYHLNLRGAERLVEEDKVIYHCAFNSQWSVAEVQTLFQDAGEIRTKFIDGRSCVVWVDVTRQEQADALTKVHSRNNAGITTLHFEIKPPTFAPEPRKAIVRAWATYLQAREPDYKSDGEEESEDESDEEEIPVGKRPREADNNPFAALQKRRKTPSVKETS